MVEMNQIFYVSCVVRKIKVFEGSPNFQLNNYIPVSFMQLYFNISSIFCFKEKLYTLQNVPSTESCILDIQKSNFQSASPNIATISGWVGGWREGTLPPIFCNHLQAGDVSFSLASSKSRVSPLKDISIAKKMSQSFKFQLHFLRHGLMKLLY